MDRSQCLLLLYPFVFDSQYLIHINFVSMWTNWMVEFFFFSNANSCIIQGAPPPPPHPQEKNSLCDPTLTKFIYSTR